ncbi:neuronal acetylcholine receptor subunit beta-3-like [Liolophura sinensis]|uniref:neuronal acetylcholine receptor subunit beta-3-like n=1 Tax=Liolophura sinensis TaxID=3198878 RepID=UPI003158D2B4
MRPVKNPTEAVLITMDITINKILKLNERDQILVSFIWIRMFWKDEFLRWNASEYGGITHFALDRGRIWTPDITLYNSVDKVGLAIPEGNKVTVTKDGNIGWYFPTVMESSCALNIRRFPFDSQICPMRFGFWAYDILALDIQNLNPHAQTEFFEENGEWQLLNAPARRGLRKELSTYPYIDFYLELERYSQFHFLFLIIPFLVIIMVTVLGFLIPVGVGDKLALTVTNLLSLVVLQLLVAERLPPQSTNMPVIAMFFCACILLVALMVALHVFVILVHKGSTSRRPPHWLQRILFPTKYGKYRDGLPDKIAIYSKEQQDNSPHVPYKPSEGFGEKQPKGTHEPLSIWTLDTKEPDSDAANLSSDPMMNDIADNILQIRQHLVGDRASQQLAKEWRNVAEKIDKILFTLVMTATTFMSIVCTLGPQYELI